MEPKANILCYYFGVWPGETSGHFLYRPDGEILYDNGKHPDPKRCNLSPWNITRLAGDMIPSQLSGLYEPQGVAILTQKENWTALTFWDRSGDYRHGSTSCFIIEGIHSFNMAMEISRLDFPLVWERFNFPINIWINPLILGSK